MVTNPFSIFIPFNKHLKVVLFTKEDSVTTDEQVAQALGVSDVAGLWQEHGNKTIRVDSPVNRDQKADGMITDRPNLVLTVRTADCQPFVIFVPDKNVLGILHVGWKGLAAGAIPEFFKVLKNEWGIEPSETVVAAGPSLCMKCADFTDPKMELSGIDKKFIEGNCADLRSAADEEFFKLGVKKGNFERNPDCTRCNPEKYWTYRGGDKEDVIKGHTNVTTCYIK